MDYKVVDESTDGLIKRYGIKTPMENCPSRLYPAEICRKWLLPENFLQNLIS